MTGESSRREIRSRGARLAPIALAVSVLARLVWTYAVPNADNFVDLHVYVGGGSVIGTGSRLYDYAYAGPTAVPLPFTYPPFAAVLFYPLHFVPFWLVAFGWLVGIMVGLYAVIRVSQRLLGGGPQWVAMAWTAVGIWLGPVRSTLDYGQINVALCLAVLCAVYSRRWWLSGLLVGLAAGIKLTPAISGLYFLGAKRYAAALWSAVVFAATVAVAALVVGTEVRRYFGDLVFDPHRMGEVSTPFNQSLRGGIGVLTGGFGFQAPLAVALVVAAVLALLAWRSVWANVAGAFDRLGGILVVELLGLLVSPISWTHHWVWSIPLLVWLAHGPRRDQPGARALVAAWVAVTLLCGPWVFQFAEPAATCPWYLSWIGLIYPVTALVTLGWMARRPSR
ncbi:mannosyltransferase [Mycobacterium sp. OTB74]|uniref:mannosyltransferase n=1 Tax=Mycobacterium sp. OTB74 TaxID=1853452 RepID=UPI0024763F90|nr:mannosyltransferase [Mycobacterium sp. OTB74]